MCGYFIPYALGIGVFYLRGPPLNDLYSRNLF